MLTVQDYREHLDAETNASHTDEELAAFRDELYTLARLILDVSNEHERMDKTT